jgi:hypothetical protein
MDATKVSMRRYGQIEMQRCESIQGVLDEVVIEVLIHICRDQQLGEM